MHVHCGHAACICSVICIALTPHCSAGVCPQVCAVDSEFVGVSQNDSCRLSAVLTATAAAGHPLATFMWGNKLSLYTRPLQAGIAIRERLMQHYRSYYSASCMCLAVLGGQSLEELQACVEDVFGPVRCCALCAVHAAMFACMMIHDAPAGVAVTVPGSVHCVGT